MAAWKAAALLALVAACGGDDESGNDVVGGWYYEREDVACGTGLSLAADGSYEHVTLCMRVDGGFDVQKELGDYAQSAAGDTLTLVPKLWSCDGAPGPTATYRVDFVSGKLRLTGRAGIVILERLPDDAEAFSGVARFGCFAADGTFTPRPVQ